MSHDQELTSLTLSDAAEWLRLKKTSSVKLTEACLARIEKLNPVLNAFITFTTESALGEVHVADEEISAGRYRGALRGGPGARGGRGGAGGGRAAAGGGGDQ